MEKLKGRININLLKHKYGKILAIILIIGIGYLMIMTQFTTNGIIHIQQKEIIDGKYYIYVNDVQLECTKTDFENVIVDSNLTYRMTYKTNFFIHDKGELITIEY